MVAQLHEYTYTHQKTVNVHFPKIKFRVYELCLNRVIITFLMVSRQRHTCPAFSASPKLLWNLERGAPPLHLPVPLSTSCNRNLTTTGTPWQLPLRSRPRAGAQPLAAQLRALLWLPCNLPLEGSEEAG